MVLAHDLKQRLAAYLGGHVSLDDFEDWFAQASWNAHKDSLPSAVSLVGAIELRLSEHSSGHLSEQELRQEFEAIMLGAPVQFSFTISAFLPMRMHFDIQASNRLISVDANGFVTSATSSVPKPGYQVVPLAVPA